MKKHIKGLFIFLIIFSFLTSAFIIAGAIMLHRFSNNKVEDELIESIRSDGKTYFYRYDRDESGKLKNDPIQIDCISGSNSLGEGYVTFDMIPDNLSNAFVAIEDKRFYSHYGIDYKRSFLAILNYIIKGKKSFGGSTITQQLVKNITGDDSVLVKRKLSEAFCAMDIERRYDKTEILEAYLNIINLSHGCRGVGDASRLYFSKEVKDLDLCECATIAAITNNPSKYDPISHPTENKKRRNLILKCMYELNYISLNDYNTAINQEINLTTSKKISAQTVNSWYIDSVIEDVIGDLAKKYSISSSTASTIFFKGGYRVYTAMDSMIQNCMESFYTDIKNFPYDSDGTTPQSSMIVIDPHSGDILGVIGAIGKKNGNRLLNFATTSKRPSGSTIKPLSVYAPALDKGLIKWSTIVEDSPIREGNEQSSPWPSNANGKYVGNVNIDYAIKHSLNTVAVKILNELKNDYSMYFLRDKLMITSLDTKLDIGAASLALGQHSRGITLRELVSAYSIFTDGIMKKSRTYYKVTDSTGRVILDNAPVENKIISEESAAIMTKLLQGVISDGTASSLIEFESSEVAGKTGTTQFSFDRYFIGFTPTLLAGVWQGFETPKSLDFIGFNYSAIIWDQIIGDIYKTCQYYSTRTKFLIPDTVRKLSYNKLSGNIDTEFSPSDDIEEGWFDIRKLTQ